MAGDDWSAPQRCRNCGRLMDRFERSTPERSKSHGCSACNSSGKPLVGK